MTNTEQKTDLKLYIVFALIYAIQGINGLPGQAVYYLVRESWGWEVSTINMIGAICMIPWIIKPIYGLISDCLPLWQRRTKWYLIINYSIILSICLYVIAFGLNFWSILITGLVAGFALAFNDVACDSVMVRAEQKAGTLGRIQSVQWTSIGVIGLIVSMGGAYIAEYWGYKPAYALMMILPTFGIWFIWKYHNEERSKPTRQWSEIKQMLKGFLDKRLLFGAIFLYCLYAPPSFGTPLMVQMREVLYIDKIFIGILGTAPSATAILGYLVYFKWGFKWNMKKKLYWCIAFGVISSLFYLYIPNQWVLLSYGIVFGLFNGIIHLTILSYAVKIVPKGSEGFIFAGMMSVLNFGTQTSISLGGLLYKPLGYNGLVILSACFMIIPLMFMKYLKKN